MIAAVIAVGLVVGALSAITPLGPVTLMVLRRALRGDSRAAMAVGLGRVVPEVVYSVLATFGVAALLEQVPEVRVGFELVGALILIIVGTVFVALDHKPRAESEGMGRRASFGAGFLLSALNPTLLISWSVIVGIALTVSGVEPTVLEKLLFPVSIGAGIALGYVALVWSVRRWGSRLEERMIEMVLKSIGALLIGLGIWHAISMARGLG